MSLTCRGCGKSLHASHVAALECEVATRTAERDAEKARAEQAALDREQLLEAYESAEAALSAAKSECAEAVRTVRLALLENLHEAEAALSAAVAQNGALREWVIGVRDEILFPLSRESSVLGRDAEGFGQASVALLAAAPVVKP